MTPLPSSIGQGSNPCPFNCETNTLLLDHSNYLPLVTLKYEIIKQWEGQRGKTEATSSQKVCATSVSTDNQGGEPTLGHWLQCYRVWYEIENFQIN